jgi:uncharacterized repeat protein (TIGR01451 family)
MKSTRQKLLLLGLVGILAFTLSGCFLRSVVGHVFVESISEEVDLNIAAFKANATTAICRERNLGDGVTAIECTYYFTGEGLFPSVTSTAELVSEFGLFGAVVDPLILQVPEGATTFQATYDDGAGPQDLLINVADSFSVQPGVSVYAEPGWKFVILEFPPGVLSTLPTGDPRDDGKEFDFDLRFQVPELDIVELKPMYTGKVEAGGEDYYIPLLPCVTDFSRIPPFELHPSEFPQNLVFQIENWMFALSMAEDPLGPCDDQVYDFTGADGGSPDISPAISIEKSPDLQTVSTGSDAVFQIRVENAGDVTLTGIAVVDAQTPGCDRVIGTLEPGEDETYQCTAPGVTADFVNIAQVSATPPGGPEGSVTHQDTASVTVVDSRSPDCFAAAPSQGILWPPDHRFVAISILGVTDPDGDDVSINIDAIRQDEPVDSTGDGKFVPDGRGVGTATADLRAERVGGSGRDRGNGRVYHVYFTASDGNGNACSGKVLVGVPHDMGQGKVPVDDGPLYDSTQG